ncbi:uncharacterized protein LOC135955200 [Calliphora vicina]|uniref:uncharacterized protein LOC135955200 n=1 Tax=Calliphora vicina TaxID=7373 RepID=UPI00325AEA86
MVLNPRCAIWKYFDNIIDEGVAVCKLCKQRLKNDRSYSLRKHINKLHNPNSEIWKHFNNIVDECVAICKICNKRVRNNRHFNLSLHLKQHDIIVDTTDKENETLSIKPSKINNPNPTSTQRIKGKLYIEMEEKTLVGAVMGLIVEEGIAPQIFASKNMQQLLSPVCDAISLQEVTKFHVDEIQSERVLSSVANHIRNEFCSDLHWRLLSLKIDMDLNATSNSFCLSVQFINEMEVETRNLGVITLKEHEHLTEQHIMEVLHQFNIDTNQIVSACWDNTKVNFRRSIENSEYLKEMQEFYKNPDIQVGDTKIERYIGVIGQLCVMDVIRNPSIFALFLECRNLTKAINDKSNIFYEKFEQSNLKIPQLDSPWKWGSSFTMMNDLNEARFILGNIKYEQPDQFNLNDNLLNFIDAFCKSLNIVQKSLLKFYNEEMHFGDFYAQWLKSKLVTEKLLNANKTQETHLKLILSELSKSIENRWNEHLNQDHFKACLYLDPRFQHTLNLPEKMFAMEYLKQLWDRSKIYNAELIDPVSESRTQSLAIPQQLDDDDEDICLNEFLCQGVQDAESSGIYNKLEEFKLPFHKVDTNILRFWRDQKICEPEMYILSTICFAMPATQIYNKIRYSHLDLSIQTSNVPPYVKGNLGFIRLNQHHLDDAVQKLGLFREDDSSDNEMSEVSEDNSVSLSTIKTMTCLQSPSAGGIDVLADIIVKSEIDDDE